MSQTVEQFYAKHARTWRSITSSPAYRDAIDTIQQTSESLKILEYSPPEVKGIGDIILAKQQGVIETLQALTKLADVPEDFGEEMPPASARYPDPLEELAAETNNNKPKPRKRK